jgi:UMF1 family MFS transporter
MFDWANSAYSTLSITVLVFYIKSVLPGSDGDRVWGWGIGVTSLAAAVLSPLLGAIADAHASKRRWLAGTAFSGAVACMLMFFATHERPLLLVATFLVSQLAMELSQCFYNGFLPEITSEGDIDRISAWGYGAGYVGGGLALLLFLLTYKFKDALGLPADDPSLLPRLGLLFMGLWWGVFTLPALFWLHDRGQPQSDASVLVAARKAVREVGTTLRHISAFRMLVIFLIGFLFYNDGVQTVLSQASVFAEVQLKMTSDELVQVILMIQFIALPGALAVGFLANRIGQKPTLLGCLAVWVGLLVAAYFVSTKTEFWILGAGVALVMGGTQSVSRAIMGQMTPLKHTAEFFGFFNLSSKAASMFGPILFTEVLARTGKPNLAIVSLIVFFVIGLLFVLRIDILAGQQQAADADATA